MSSIYMGAANPQVARNASFVTGTVGGTLAEPGTTAVSELGGNHIYVNPGSFGLRLGNVASIFHEVLHNVTGLTDDEIQSNLGLAVTPVTFNITQKLFDDCLKH